MSQVTNQQADLVFWHIYFNLQSLTTAKRFLSSFLTITTPTKLMDHPENATTSRGRKATRSTNFMILEDEAICRAWIYVNEDSIVGAGQRVAHFWESIFENFKGRVGDDNRRTKDSIQSRFVNIQRAYNRWAGIISSIERTARSGTTIQDRMVEAKSMFM